MKASTMHGKCCALAIFMLLSGVCCTTAEDGAPGSPRHNSAPPQGVTPADPAAVNWQVQSDHWYSLTLGGARAGWMRIVREDDGSRYRTVNETRMRIEHGDAKLDSHTYAEWIESHAGQPLKIHVAQRSDQPSADENPSVWEETRSGDPHRQLIAHRQWIFKGPQVTKIATNESGEELRAAQPAPTSGWRTPVAAERFIQSRIAEGAPKLEYSTLHASDALSVINVRSTRFGETQFRLSRRRIPVTVWQTEASAEKAQTVSHFSQDGKLVYSVSDVGIGLLETRMTNKDVALELAPRDENKPVTPEISLGEKLTASNRLEIELTVDAGELPAFPSVGAQTVEALNEGRTARITIDVDQSTPASQIELMDAQLRQGASDVALNDPLVVALAARAMRQTKGLTSLDIAESSRAVVHQHFAQSALAPPTHSRLNVSASPTGFDQATMLASVLRVHQVASRLAWGLAYRPSSSGPGAFTWRVWNQALIEGKWVDFDSMEAGRFTPGHVLLDFSLVSDARTAPDAPQLPAIILKVIAQN